LAIANVCTTQIEKIRYFLMKVFQTMTPFLSLNTSLGDHESIDSEDVRRARRTLPDLCKPSPFVGLIPDIVSS